MIGTGYSELRKRLGPPAWTALAVLVLGYALDTGTTLAAGDVARSADTNPLVRGFSSAGYVGFSILRLGLSAAILLWFWPRGLVPRFGSTALRLAVPLAYSPVAAYFGAWLVLLVAPLKYLAALSNAVMLAGGGGGGGGGPALPGAATAPVGLALGVLLANAVLYWRYREIEAG